jgi:hypothetical protein
MQIKPDKVLVYFVGNYLEKLILTNVKKLNFLGIKKIREEKIVSLFGRKNRNKLTVNSKNYAVVSISSLILFRTEKQCGRLNKVLCVHCANNV